MRVKIAVLEWPKTGGHFLVYGENPGRFGCVRTVQNGDFSFFELFSKPPSFIK